MRTLAVINATKLNEYAFLPVAEGQNAFERTMQLAVTYCRPEDTLVLIGEDQEPPLLPPGAVLGRSRVSGMLDIMVAMKAFAEERKDADALLYAHGDGPFLDRELTERLLALHRQYRAEYTYADGYPAGFSPEVLSTRILPNLVDLASRNQVGADRDGLFSLIQKDINSYDIETELAPLDLRGYRLGALCDGKRGFLSAQGLWNVGVRSAQDVVRVLPSHPELLRTVPAFLWVQVAEACPQSCSYCPYPQLAGDPRGKKGYMPLERFESVMEQAERLCDELVVDLSLWGEPALHPDFLGLARSVLARNRFTLIVETSGIGWAPGVAEAVAKLGGTRVHWIVSLDDPDPSSYAALRGEGMEEALAFAKQMASLAPGQIHAQAVRMKGNEERLESFYRTWKKDIDKVIVQKYDSFAGALPDLSVADLSPLERYPCRHLARDMAVLLDGSVPPCKHCLVKSDEEAGRLSYAASLGNAFEPEGLRKAWEAGGSWYGRHTGKDYPAFCEACDEYHTFNA